MNRLALIAVTGFLALALTACGEHGNSKPTAGASDNAAVQQDQNQVAAPAPAQAPAQTPAQEQPADGQHH